MRHEMRRDPKSSLIVSVWINFKGIIIFSEVMLLIYTYIKKSTKFKKKDWALKIKAQLIMQNNETPPTNEIASIEQLGGVRLRIQCPGNCNIFNSICNSKISSSSITKNDDEIPNIFWITLRTTSTFFFPSQEASRHYLVRHQTRFSHFSFCYT